MNFIIETKSELTDQQIAGVLVSAFEGGIGYWAVIKEIVLPKSAIPDPENLGWVLVGSEGHPSYIAAPLLDGGYVQIVDMEDDNEKSWVVNRQAISRGLHLMANGEFRNQFNNIINEDYDAGTGDVLIQLAVFGEVKYG